MLNIILVNWLFLLLLIVRNDVNFVILWFSVLRLSLYNLVFCISSKFINENKNEIIKIIIDCC